MSTILPGSSPRSNCPTPQEQSSTVGLVHQDHLAQVKAHRRQRSLSSAEVSDPSLELRNLRTIRHPTNTTFSSPVIDPIDAQDPELLYSSGSALLGSSNQQPIAWSLTDEDLPPSFPKSSTSRSSTISSTKVTSTSKSPPPTSTSSQTPIATMSTSTTSPQHTTTAVSSSHYLPQLKEDEVSQSQIWIHDGRKGEQQPGKVKLEVDGDGAIRNGKDGDGSESFESAGSSSLDNEIGNSFDRFTPFDSSADTSYDASRSIKGKVGDQDPRNSSASNLRSGSSFINSPFGSEVSQMKAGFDMVSPSRSSPSNPRSNTGSRFGDVDTDDDKTRASQSGSFGPKQSTPRRDLSRSGLVPASRRLPPPRLNAHPSASDKERDAFFPSSDLGEEPASSSSQDEGGFDVSYPSPLEVSVVGEIRRRVREKRGRFNRIHSKLVASVDSQRQLLSTLSRSFLHSPLNH